MEREAPQDLASAGAVSAPQLPLRAKEASAMPRRWGSLTGLAAGPRRFCCTHWSSSHHRIRQCCANSPQIKPSFLAAVSASLPPAGPSELCPEWWFLDHFWDSHQSVTIKTIAIGLPHVPHPDCRAPSLRPRTAPVVGLAIPSKGFQRHKGTEPQIAQHLALF